MYVCMYVYLLDICKLTKILNKTFKETMCVLYIMHESYNKIETVKN